VREAVDVPLLAGTGSYDTRHTWRLSERAADCGSTALLVVSPYYNRPPAGRHRRPHAGGRRAPPTCRSSCTTCPPAPGGRMTVDTIVRLANEVPTIVGLKDARGNPAEAARIVADAPRPSTSTRATTP
jgi:4-hydroxy-tetrahydrodipicolinate synthase